MGVSIGIEILMPSLRSPLLAAPNSEITGPDAGHANTGAFGSGARVTGASAALLTVVVGAARGGLPWGGVASATRECCWLGRWSLTPQSNAVSGVSVQAARNGAQTSAAAASFLQAFISSCPQTCA